MLIRNLMMERDVKEESRLLISLFLISRGDHSEEDFLCSFFLRRVLGLVEIGSHIRASLQLEVFYLMVYLS